MVHQKTDEQLNAIISDAKSLATSSSDTEIQRLALAVDATNERINRFILGLAEALKFPEK